MTKEKVELRERDVVMTPNLTLTLMSLEPGDYVHCGNNWSYGTIRQTASSLGVKIQTRRTSNGITVLCPLEVPEPK